MRNGLRCVGRSKCSCLGTPPTGICAREERRDCSRRFHKRGRTMHEVSLQGSAHILFSGNVLYDDISHEVQAQRIGEDLHVHRQPHCRKRPGGGDHTGAPERVGQDGCPVRGPIHHRGSGQAVDFAKNATGEVVVAVGGDGTINEVANGLLAGKVLGIIPAGSGNDLIKSLRVPKKPSEALKCLLEDHVIEIDTGIVKCNSGKDLSPRSSCSERVFLNGVGVGFDATVAIRKSQITFLKGQPSMCWRFLGTLRTYRAPVFTMKMNGFPRDDEATSSGSDRKWPMCGRRVLPHAGCRSFRRTPGCYVHR